MANGTCSTFSSEVPGNSGSNSRESLKETLINQKVLFEEHFFLASEHFFKKDVKNFITNNEIFAKGGN